ncbi:MAG TPA: alcohol dehydrogenase catalytic domain-containing protein, partial [Candidatus Angelobacter sp.]
MKALVLKEPGKAVVEEVPEPVAAAGGLRLKVRMVGLCGSDLKSYQGMNPLVTFPRILGHEVAATIDSGLDGATIETTNVAVSPYTHCGSCASCRRNRPNACQFNQTLGVQRDGAMTDFITMAKEKVFPSKLALREL